MIFEDIFKEIGDFGRGQIFQYFLLCWPFLMAGFLSVDVVFLMAVPEFVCKPDNVTMYKLQLLSNTTSVSKIADILILLQKSMDNYKTSRCYSWNTSMIMNLTSINLIANRSRLDFQNVTLDSKCSNGFIYSTQSYGSTAPNEYDLVCDSDYIRSNLKTIFFAGRIFGAVIFGQLSDIIGRLRTFLIVVVFNLIAGLGLYFSINPIMIGGFLLLQGFSQVGYTLTTFVLGCELVGTSKRKWTGTVLQLFYTAAFILIPLCYWGMQNWRYLALFSGLPSIFFLSYFFIVYESPRWLLSKGRSKEALIIIEKVGKTNHIKLSENLKTEILKHHESEEYKNDTEKKHSVFDLIKSKSMLLLSLNVWFNWIVNALIYYGIIYNVENLAGSLYLNFILLGLVEIPAYVLNLLFLDRIGRRNLLIISLWGTGVACLLSGCVPKYNTVIIATIAMIGKLTVTMSYGVVYFYTSELFPTTVRNAAMGVSSMSARIGGTMATPILLLDHYFSPLPMIIFAILSAVAGGLTFKMPETKGKPLDQNFHKSSVKNERKTAEDDPKPLINDEKV
uniref:Slc22a-8 n=1 Tax=Schmidtea mediterranea TaxID=79327 RepID=A0A0H3YJ43_SCHMD|nr:slc22a-8 [Schmidtea mediterranea]